MASTSDDGGNFNVPAPERRPILSWDGSAPDVALRKTGFSFIPEMPWGSHVCLFYRTAQDLADADIAYFNAGLQNNEYCMCVVSPPNSVESARLRLRKGIPDLDRHIASGNFELREGDDWYQPRDPLGVRLIIDGWRERLAMALAAGHEGLRVKGEAFWQQTNLWTEFMKYEQALEDTLAGHRMLVLCAYAIEKSDADGILNVATAHQCTIAIRDGRWEFMKVPGHRHAEREVRALNGGSRLASKSFSGHESLTPRERVVLAQIMKGASSKEAARVLGISHRTVDFHRANLLQKLGAKNTAALVRAVLGKA
ncbi:MAG: MEDS domain-containing protein [Rhizomicrobium sp.]|jgi:DNA-binding CsgD family transcriptional regulator